jgi:hypothetical protein
MLFPLVSDVAPAVDVALLCFDEYGLGAVGGTLDY